MPDQENDEGGRELENVLNLREDESGAFHVEPEEIADSETGTADETLMVLKEDLKKKNQEIKNKDDRYRYLLADFENYKKRAQKDQMEQSKFSNERLLKEVLVVLDDLERAIAHFKKAHDFENIVEGLALVSKQFLSFLSRFGVIPIESLNKPFDPACHQAVGHVDRSDLSQGEVVEEVQRGYMLHDRLIRPSFVLISKKGDEEAINS
jgi:molecular chaperone GrpE